VTQALTNLDRLTLPTAPVNTTVELFRATLEKARDTGMPSRLLNASVERGLDAVFRDALSGRDFNQKIPPSFESSLIRSISISITSQVLLSGRSCSLVFISSISLAFNRRTLKSSATHISGGISII
jgi:hypothetical protein